MQPVAVRNIPASGGLILRDTELRFLIPKTTWAERDVESKGCPLSLSSLVWKMDLQKSCKWEAVVPGLAQCSSSRLPTGLSISVAAVISYERGATGQWWGILSKDVVRWGNLF